MDFWTKLKNYLNESLRNNEKRRIVIINELKRDDPVHIQERPYIIFPKTHDFRNTVNGCSINTLDSYLNYLFQAGYLYKPSYGTYGLSREIPVDLSLADVKNEAYALDKKNIGDRENLRRHGIMLHEKNKGDFFKEEEFAI